MERRGYGLGRAPGWAAGDSVLDVGLRERLTGRRRLHSVGCRNWRREGGAPPGNGSRASRAPGHSQLPLEVQMSAQLLAEPPLATTDPAVAELIEDEIARQSETICLIPSENYVSRAVLEAMGSVFTNKYSEGYAERRYYEGQQLVDRLEPLAIERARELFGVEHANVQPYSGSPANLAVYLAFCEPGDTVMGMALPMGGHLTHGWDVSITGKWFRSIQYGVRRDTGRVDWMRCASSR